MLRATNICYCLKAASYALAHVNVRFWKTIDEGWAANDELVEDKCSRPNVHRFSILLTHQQLGGTVPQGTHGLGIKLTLRPDGCGRTEVADSQNPKTGAFLKQEAVLRLEVAVHDIGPVQLFHAAYKIEEPMCPRTCVAHARCDASVQRLPPRLKLPTERQISHGHFDDQAVAPNLF